MWFQQTQLRVWHDLRNEPSNGTRASVSERVRNAKRRSGRASPAKHSRVRSGHLRKPYGWVDGDFCKSAVHSGLVFIKLQT